MRLGGVGPGVPHGGGITTPDMAAGETQTQMNPRSAQRQTLLAALRRAYPHRTNLREMRIRNSGNHVRSYLGPATEPASPREAAIRVASALTGGLGAIRTGERGAPDKAQ